MKKFLLATNILTLFLLGFYSCRNNPPEDPVTACPTCYPTQCTDSFSGVNALLAKHMVGKYRVNHWMRIINGSSADPLNPIMDSRSVWFSLATLKRFIYQVESKSCASCLGDTTTLGVRIYYSEYPIVNASQWNDYELDPTLQQSYQGLETVLMVPTYFDNRYNLDVDFQPGYMQETSEGCYPVPIDTVMGHFLRKDSLIAGGPRYLLALAPQLRSTTTAPGGEESSAPPAGSTDLQNHGGLEPPPWSDQGFPPFLTRNCTGSTFCNFADGALAPCP